MLRNLSWVLIKILTSRPCPAHLGKPASDQKRMYTFQTGRSAHGLWGNLSGHYLVGMFSECEQKAVLFLPQAKMFPFLNMSMSRIDLSFNVQHNWSAYTYIPTTPPPPRKMYIHIQEHRDLPGESWCSCCLYHKQLHHLIPFIKCHCKSLPFSCCSSVPLGGSSRAFLLW